MRVLVLPKEPGSARERADRGERDDERRRAEEDRDDVLAHRLAPDKDEGHGDERTDDRAHDGARRTERSRRLTRLAHVPRDDTDPVRWYPGSLEGVHRHAGPLVVGEGRDDGLFLDLVL